MKTEIPIASIAAGHRTASVPAIWDEIPKELLGLAAFSVIAAAVALGLAIAVPLPADTAAAWLGQFSG